MKFQSFKFKVLEFFVYQVILNTTNFIPKCRDKLKTKFYLCIMTGLVYKSTGSWYTVKSEHGDFI